MLKNNILYYVYLHLNDPDNNISLILSAYILVVQGQTISSVFFRPEGHARRFCQVHFSSFFYMTEQNRHDIPLAVSNQQFRLLSHSYLDTICLHNSIKNRSCIFCHIQSIPTLRCDVTPSSVNVGCFRSIIGRF